MVFNSLVEWVLENDESSSRPLYKAIVGRAKRENTDIKDVDFEEKEYLESTKKNLKLDLQLLGVSLAYTGVLGVAILKGGVGKKSIVGKNAPLFVSATIVLGLGIIATTATLKLSAFPNEDYLTQKYEKELFELKTGENL